MHCHGYDDFPSRVPALNQAVRTTAGGKRNRHQHREEATKVTGKRRPAGPARRHLITSRSLYLVLPPPPLLAWPGPPWPLSFRARCPAAAGARQQRRHLPGRAAAIVRPTRGCPAAACPPRERDGQVSKATRGGRSWAPEAIMIGTGSLVPAGRPAL